MSVYIHTYVYMYVYSIWEFKLKFVSRAVENKQTKQKRLFKIIYFVFIFFFLVLLECPGPFVVNAASTGRCLCTVYIKPHQPQVVISEMKN